MKIQIGKDADIGNNNEQQDDMIIIQKPEIDCTIICVVDGHGRDTGKLAANACTKSLDEFTDANIELLCANPVEFLEKCYEFAQDRVLNAFKQEYLEREHEVKIEDAGYVVKRRYSSQSFSNVNGGAMMTVIVVKNGKMYVSNVGDCHAALFTETPVMTTQMMKFEKDAAGFHGENINMEMGERDPLNTVVVTFDHSPESVEEYRRIRKFRPSVEDPNHAELLFVYDEINREKALCNRIFKITEDGTPTIMSDVPYYNKNVKAERATYVTAPFDARFRESIASTRAIGDFYLNSYGVSAKPQILSFDLTQLLEQTDTACLVVASDGVWDAWINDHVNKFVMDPSCLKAVTDDPVFGAQKVAKSFMRRTCHYNQKYFRGNADNASAIVAYFTKEPINEGVFSIPNA